MGEAKRRKGAATKQPQPIIVTSNVRARFANGLSVWKQKLVAMANANESLMDGTMNPIQDILADNELVFAVWQDAQAENGVDIMLVKGEPLLLKIMADNQPMPARTSAIKCVEYE